MRLAINYSREAARLVATGVVDVDFFKCPGCPELIAEARQLRPATVHGDLWIGDGRLDDRGARAVADGFRGTGTELLNVHLAPTTRHLAREPKAAEREQLIAERTRHDLERLARYWPRTRIACENVPTESRIDFPIDALAADPRLVTRVVDTNRVAFLLDVAHARFAARARDMTAEELIEGYPVERLVELHVTGLGLDSTGRVRDSMPLTAVDWPLIEWCLDRLACGDWPRPWALVLEYGGVGPHFAWRTSATVIARELTRLAALLGDRGLR